MLMALCAAVLAVQSPATSPDSPEEAPAVTTETADGSTELLDDIGEPPPGAIEPPLEVIERDPSNWFGIPPEKEWLNIIRDPLKKLNEEHGLLFAGAYTILFQQSIGPDAHSAASGDFDLTGRWTIFGRGTPDIGSIYVAGEYRHKIGNIPPSALGSEIGTLLGTTDGFSDRGWSVKDLYYAQRLFNDRFRFGLGRVDSENLVGAHELQSANTSFMNKAFSVNPTMAFPGSGMGGAASVRPIEWMYVAAGGANAYGNTTTSEIDSFFDEFRLFKWVEAGVTPKIEGLGKGKYRVAVWHMDSRSDEDQPSDEGFTIIFDQEVGEQLSLFLRYGYAEADLTGVQQSVQGGAGVEGLIGSSSDLTGVALAWSEPETDGLPDEKTLEVFHRLQLTGRTQLTFGAQLIVDPSNSDEDALGVFSARFRLTF